MPLHVHLSWHQEEMKRLPLPNPPNLIDIQMLQMTHKGNPRTCVIVLVGTIEGILQDTQQLLVPNPPTFLDIRMFLYAHIIVYIGVLARLALTLPRVLVEIVSFYCKLSHLPLR